MLHFFVWFVLGFLKRLPCFALLLTSSGFCALRLHIAGHRAVCSRSPGASRWYLCWRCHGFPWCERFLLMHLVWLSLFHWAWWLSNSACSHSYPGVFVFAMVTGLWPMPVAPVLLVVFFTSSWSLFWWFCFSFLAVRGTRRGGRLLYCYSASCFLCATTRPVRVLLWNYHYIFVCQCVAGHWLQSVSFLREVFGVHCSKEVRGLFSSVHGVLLVRRPQWVRNLFFARFVTTASLSYRLACDCSLHSFGICIILHVGFAASLFWWPFSVLFRKRIRELWNIDCTIRPAASVGMHSRLHNCQALLFLR